jgi:hypothetical protein
LFVWSIRVPFTRKKGSALMGSSSNLARQRLTHFLAARLKARQCEVNQDQQGSPDRGLTIPSCGSEESSAQIAHEAALTSSATPQSELEHS